MDTLMTPDEFTDLFQLTSGRVHAYAVRQVGRDAADDLVSETYAVAWRRRDSIGIPALPWLFVVARNLASNHHRGLRRAERLWLDAVQQQWRSPGASTPDAVVLTRETAMAALAGCTRAEREALLLTAWDGLTATEAARVAGCSTRAFTVRLSRARARFDRLYRQADSDPHLPDPDGPLEAQAAASPFAFSPAEDLP